MPHAETSRGSHFASAASALVSEAIDCNAESH